ncbi:hypothetical protein [Marinobacterium arenosum]|uniref:hypothetical protein n=1 Tax=Marinobacterium arenosum TaxID=2862496 RepID=UPI001C94EA75|nr:hypothetical protein [Marinobacterium arenosum]MBY4676827.1 hypothetical protein [Marinobacterium arenosum]
MQIILETLAALQVQVRRWLEDPERVPSQQEIEALRQVIHSLLHYPLAIETPDNLVRVALIDYEQQGELANCSPEVLAKLGSLRDRLQAFDRELVRFAENIEQLQKAIKQAQDRNELN